MPHDGKLRLKNLDFDEVSLVSSGDDPQALLVLSKSNPEGRTMYVLGDSFGKRRKRRNRKPKLGSGKRFSQLSAELAGKGARDPHALAAWIGRRKYGKKKFASLAKSPHDGDGDGKYSIHRGAPDITPLPRFLPRHRVTLPLHRPVQPKPSVSQRRAEAKEHLAGNKGLPTVRSGGPPPGVRIIPNKKKPKKPQSLKKN